MKVLSAVAFVSVPMVVAINKIDKPDADVVR